MGRILLLLVCLMGVIYSSYGQQQLNVVWDNGLRFKGGDGAYEIEVGGRLLYDVLFLEHDKYLDENIGPDADKVEIRRARISLEGYLRDALEYEFEVSFADEFEFKDMRVSFLKVPVVDAVTVGHFREPFGMEENTSSNNIPLMERSLTSAFGTSRNAGIMLQRQFFNNRLGVYTGAFRITDDFGSDREANGNHSISGRIAFVPVIDSTRNRVLHVGFGFNTKDPVGGVIEVETQNESNLAPSYIAGDLENVNRVWLLGGEAGFSQGRFTLQSEYMHAFARLLDVTAVMPGDDIQEFNSFYVTGAYFLKGGNRRYDNSDHTFAGIEVESPYPMAGAWEAALRFSQIRLLDAPQEFSRMNDLTVGLNYYLSATTRLMMNYIFSRIEEEHHAQALQFRLQLAF